MLCIRVLCLGQVCVRCWLLVSSVLITYWLCWLGVGWLVAGYVLATVLAKCWLCVGYVMVMRWFVVVSV